MRAKARRGVIVTAASAAIALAASAAPAPTAVAGHGEGGGPGSPLGDGFSVAKGSRLVGTVFPGPTLSDAVTVGGADTWTAVLELDGNPIKVFNRFLRQAQGAGFELGADCFLAYDDGRGVPVTGRTPDREGLLSLTCTALGRGGERSGVPEKELAIELHRSADGAPYEDNVTVRVARRPDPDAPRFPLQNWHGPFPSEWSTGVPTPPKRPKLARADQPIRPGDARAVRLIDVVEGTKLLAPPALSCAQRGGFDAVFEVTGDIEEVLDAYAIQFERIDMTTERSEESFRGNTVTRDDGIGDAGNYAATAVHGKGGRPAYVFLWFCPFA
jgi:hypothetical protein